MQSQRLSGHSKGMSQEGCLGNMEKFHFQKAERTLLQYSPWIDNYLMVELHHERSQIQKMGVSPKGGCLVCLPLLLWETTPLPV